MRRTLINLPEDLLGRADRYCAQHRFSRAELVRRALDAFLPEGGGDGFGRAFGILADEDADGESIEARVGRLRDEWEER